MVERLQLQVECSYSAAAMMRLEVEQGRRYSSSFDAVLRRHDQAVDERTDEARRQRASTVRHQWSSDMCKNKNTNIYRTDE